MPPAEDGVNTKSEHSITNTALLYADFGMCILPLWPGTKKVALPKWEQYMKVRPTEAQLIAWFDGKDRGIAVVAGAVSGGLCCRDFDVDESYERWAEENQALAKALPTVRTARGHHVYCRSDRQFTKDQGDGEFRATGITALPPTRHESGHMYRWQVDLPHAVEDVPFLDPVEVGLAHRVGTQPSQATQPPQAIGWKGSECEEESQFASLSLEQIIASTLPTGPGQRNCCLFKLARCLRGHEDFEDADWPTLRPVVQDWHRRALPVIETKDFIETETDFLRAWPRVRSPMGCDYLAMIRERAMMAQPSDLAQKWGMEGFGFLIQLCDELQQDAGDGPFFLSTRDAGRLMHIPHRTASRMLTSLTYYDILEIEKKGEFGTLRATTFRFLGEKEN
ncbi:MAG: bifunctional DNA primase/polymerase [Planctomycetota bacterium]|nr:bifunctional DNA primase/polymerase [Planctomycetota bacterium]